jgi:hypothetical protein
MDESWRLPKIGDSPIPDFLLLSRRRCDFISSLSDNLQRFHDAP